MHKILFVVAIMDTQNIADQLTASFEKLILISNQYSKVFLLNKSKCVKNIVTILSLLLKS